MSTRKAGSSVTIAVLWISSVLDCRRTLHHEGGIYNGLLDYAYEISGLEQTFCICLPIHTPFIFVKWGQVIHVFIILPTPPFAHVVSHNCFVFIIMLLLCSQLLLFIVDRSPWLQSSSFFYPPEDTSQLNQPQLLLQRPVDDEWQVILTRVPSLKP